MKALGQLAPAMANTNSGCNLQALQAPGGQDGGRGRELRESEREITERYHRGPAPP